MYVYNIYLLYISLIVGYLCRLYSPTMWECVQKLSSLCLSLQDIAMMSYYALRHHIQFILV